MKMYSIKSMMFFIFSMTVLSTKAQWTPSGNDISNSNSGSVKIGNTSPGFKLGVTIPVSTSTAGGDPNAYGVYFTDSFSSTLAIRSLGTGVMHLATDGGSRGLVLGGGGFEQTLFINSGSKVGIGTGSPSTLLSLGTHLNSRIVSLWDDPNDWYGLGIQNSQYRFQVGNPNARFSFFAGDNNEVFTINGNGNVGIGTTTPSTKLEVSGDAKIRSRLQFGTADAYGGSYGVIGLQTGVPGKNIVFFNYDGPVNELMTLNGTTGSAAINNGGLTVSGNVGIGTTSPDAKLAVSGQVHAQEVKVSVTVPGPDYVFEKDYKLTSLEEIKNYIDQNKHLPEVPSAKEMEKNGVQLGEMNMLLLKKIEELTLYVIAMKKENNNQNDLIGSQQREIEELRSLIKNIK